MKQAISILGSTGSIGRQSLDVIKKLGLKATALTANKNIKLMEEQTREFKPELVVMQDEIAGKELKVKLADTETKVLWGEEGLSEAAVIPSADTVITAVVGNVGLYPTLNAIREKKRIALANKETLVCAGHIVMAEAKKNSAEIIPVDSEHSAIFQCLEAGNRNEMKRILLTASGGPFRGMKTEQLKAMTRKQALRHPNWSMGAKITIDSATLMNKGLEFIEAMHLFGAEPDQITVLVHPQSIVHSMVQFRDNSVIAQMGMPDMRLPIEYALSYPERAGEVISEADFTDIGTLTFEKPDTDTFKCLGLALSIAGKQDASCAVMNAANEAAVGLFLEDKINFCEIYELVNETVQELGGMKADNLEDILFADRKARSRVFGKVKTCI